MPQAGIFGPVESAGKLWYLTTTGKDATSRLLLGSIDIQTKAAASFPIAIPQPERFFKKRIDGSSSMDMPSQFLVTGGYVFFGPLHLKSQYDTDYWFSVNCRTAAVKEIVVPPLPSAGGTVFPAFFTLKDRVHWLFGVDHPEKSRGVMTVNLAEGSWKYIPCPRLAEANLRSSSNVSWNEARNTLSFTSDSATAEFDLQSNVWLDASRESRLPGQDLVSTPGHCDADYTAQACACSLKTDPAKGTWNVSVVDPDTRLVEHFVLKLAVEGLSLGQSEQQVLQATDPSSRGLEAGVTRSGLWFKLRNQVDRGGFDESTYRCFWLPWSEIRKGEPATASPNLLAAVDGGKRQILSMNLNRPGYVRQEVRSCYEILDRNVATASALVRTQNPTAYLWGRKGADGAFVWRATPITAARTSTAASLSPDGLGVRYVSADKREIREWRSDANTEKTLFTAPESEEIVKFAYCSDGVAFAWAGKKELHWQPASGDAQTLPIPVGSMYPLTWSPDGKYLAAGGGIDLLARDGDTLKAESKVKGSRAYWTGDSARLITKIWAGNQRTFQIVTVADGSAKPLVPDFNSNENVFLSADGKSLIAGGSFATDRARFCVLQISLADGSYKELMDGVGAVDFLPVAPARQTVSK